MSIICNTHVDFR